MEGPGLGLGRMASPESAQMPLRTAGLARASLHTNSHQLFLSPEAGARKDVVMAVNFIAPLGGPTALPTLVMVLTQSLEGRPHHHMGQDKQRAAKSSPQPRLPLSSGQWPVPAPFRERVNSTGSPYLISALLKASLCPSRERLPGRQGPLAFS